MEDHKTTGQPAALARDAGAGEAAPQAGDAPGPPAAPDPAALPGPASALVPAGPASVLGPAQASGTRRLGRRIWDHIGMLTGIVIAGLAVGGTVFLAAIGFAPALFLLVLIVAGLVLLIVGGRIKAS